MSDISNNPINRTSRPWWPKSEGDTVAGTVVAIGITMGPQNHPGVQIRDLHGNFWTVPLFHKVLKNKWNQLNPRPGHEVTIVYLGERESKTTGWDYKDYQLTVTI